MTRTQGIARILLATLVLGTAVLGCGRYGAPQPYPPAVEEEEEERS